MLSSIINAGYEGSNQYINDCKNILNVHPSRVLYFLCYFATFENPKKKVFYCVSVVKKNPYENDNIGLLNALLFYNQLCLLYVIIILDKFYKMEEKVQGSIKLEFYIYAYLGWVLTHDLGSPLS